MGRLMQKFSKEVSANNEKNALEKVYADLGSKHKVKRRFIKIEEVKELGEGKNE